MEVRQIQSFVTVTQLGSFSKAAQVLGYSQSAITVQIRLLEEELDLNCLTAWGRGWRLPPRAGVSPYVRMKF